MLSLFSLYCRISFLNCFRYSFSFLLLKGIKDFIPDWDELIPKELKKGISKPVFHIETGMEFKSLKLGCDYFKYDYPQQSSGLRNKSKLRKFNYI